MITYFLILVNHFISDFLFQTDKMATKKSTSNKWLTIHALTYMIVMSPIGMYMDYQKYGHILWFSWGIGSSWWVINFILISLTILYISYQYKKHQNDDYDKPHGCT